MFFIFAQICIFSAIKQYILQGSNSIVVIVLFFYHFA